MLNPAFHYPPMRPEITMPFPSFTTVPHQGLTDGEKEVLNALKEAWEKFVALGSHVDHDLTEFNYAIHLAQQKLAVRVARRVDPDVWRQPQQSE
jgi:hypothetical protein